METNPRIETKEGNQNSPKKLIKKQTSKIWSTYGIKECKSKKKCKLNGNFQ